LWASLIIYPETSDSSRQSFADMVNQAIAKAPSPLPLSSQTEQSDDWLNVDPTDFDDMLAHTFKNSSPSTPPHHAMDVDIDQPSPAGEDYVAKKQTERLQELATQVSQFVEGEGDLEGARFEE
jgi:hypothetical protein